MLDRIDRKIWELSHGRKHSKFHFQSRAIDIADSEKRQLNAIGCRQDSNPFVEFQAVVHWRAGRRQRQCSNW